MQTISDTTTPIGGSTVARETTPAVQTTMRAVVQDTYGSSEVLTLMDRPLRGQSVLPPMPGAGPAPKMVPGQ